MSSLQVRLPRSVHDRLSAYAAQEQEQEQEQVSVDQFVATAVAEKLAALATEDHLRRRGGRGGREAFEAALAQMPDIEPDPIER